MKIKSILIFAVSLLLAASPLLAGRVASEVIFGDSPKDCDCPRTATPTITATFSPMATETATPTPSATLTATPDRSLKDIIQLGFPAVWESADVLLITLADELTHFDTDQDTLKPEGQRRLEALAKVLLTFPDNTLRVDGHTDNHGSYKHNAELSRRRAKRVQDTLMNMGIEEKRFDHVEGWGYERPIAKNDSPENLAKNRRVELRLKFSAYMAKAGGPLQALTPTPTSTASPTPSPIP
jgi:outer membrane protein OmpA-like peptidoglycan-associated protein